MGIATHRENGSYTEPNVIPLIDILLVLLIIFMLLAVRFKSFHVNVPMEVSNDLGSTSRIVLSITDTHTYEINGQSIDGERLEEEIQAVFEGRPDRLLFIDADRQRSYQEVVETFSVARQAGVQALALMPRKR